LVIPFRRGEPLLDKIDLFLWSRNAFLGLFLKGVQYVLSII